MNTNDIDFIKMQILDIISRHHEMTPNINCRLDYFLETLEDNNQFNNLEQVLSWYENRQRKLNVEINEIGLKDVEGGWHYEDNTGNLVHESGGFFKVIGVRVNTEIREVKGGWDQPMIDQGTESSIAGILRKKFNEIPHYLLEAKFEPGNYGKIQFSPTLQVTYSNLNQLHKGRKPRYSEYFEYPEKYKLLYEKWQPEDGGRFYLKRIKNMLVEVDESENIEVPEGFIWVTLYQIKELLQQDNIVNPHVRSILSFM